MTFLHCLDRFLARRVEQPDQAEQNQILWQVGGRETAAPYPWTVKPSQSEHAFALSGELVRRFQEMFAGERHVLPADRLLPITVIEDDLARALDPYHLPTVPPFLYRPPY